MMNSRNASRTPSQQGKTERLSEEGRREAIMKRRLKEDGKNPCSKKRKADREEDESKKKKKKRKKVKKKKRVSPSSGSSLSSDSTRSSSSSEDERRKRKKRRKAERKEKRKERKLKKESKGDKKTNPVEPVVGPAVPQELLSASKRMAPMTKEEWEKQQSQVRRVYDEETGRYRLIKGTGEVLEEIVSKERHQEINRQATLGDGQYFQAKLGQIDLPKN